MSAALRALALTLLLSVGAGCGVDPLPERLGVYADEIDAALEHSGVRDLDGMRLEEPDDAPILPRRSSRRRAAVDERIGAFEFLATIGCSLATVAAERNGPLGRVMVPSRRWDYERRVIEALEACLPTVGPERASRLRSVLDRKRATLALHRWNAIWIEEELERYLGRGVPALIGGGRRGDGPRQLTRVARAIEQGDLVALEVAWSELRDDPPAGPRLLGIARGSALLRRVADRLEAHGSSVCDRRARRLVRVFQHRFVPLRSALSADARFAADLADAVDALFAVSGNDLPLSPEMRRYRRAILGEGAGHRLDDRHRAALVAHAQAWSTTLEACDLLPRAAA
jgi:hypothetical protein